MLLKTGQEITDALNRRINAADKRYGPFASVHEGMGVALEEWHELIEAVHSNHALHIQREALDLCAALMRLCRDVSNVNTHQRSGLYEAEL